MTDKEVRAIAIKEVTYADMIAIGATEEIAMVASWKARCAFEASWDCAVDKACEWLENNAYLYVNDIDQINESALIGDFRGVMED
jgi:hypothetical protein